MTKRQAKLLAEFAEMCGPVMLDGGDLKAVRVAIFERKELLTTLEIIRDWLADPDRDDEREYNLGLIRNVIDRAKGGVA